MLLSIVINCDTRPENSTAETMFNGTVNEDYLTDGIFNKIKFFEGFDKEVIVFIDEHLPVPDTTLQYLRSLVDAVVIRKHSNELNFNDYNYLNALSMARGEIVVHFDQDTACFTNSKDYVQELINHLDNHKFVSYPSHWTPKPVHDESFGVRTWASTRFFICKKETLNFDVLRKCIENPEWAYEVYGDSPRRCNWMEHFLTLTNENDCYYPPVELHKGAIFSWATYSKYTLRRLNELDYETIKQWILHRGGINYPVDVKCE